jgi:hypothetical protein
LDFHFNAPLGVAKIGMIKVAAIRIWDKPVAITEISLIKILIGIVRSKKNEVGQIEIGKSKIKPDSLLLLRLDLLKLKPHKSLWVTSKYEWFRLL